MRYATFRMTEVSCYTTFRITEVSCCILFGRSSGGIAFHLEGQGAIVRFILSERVWCRTLFRLTEFGAILHLEGQGREALR